MEHVVFAMVEDLRLQISNALKVERKARVQGEEDLIHALEIACDKVTDLMAHPSEDDRP